MLRVLLRVLLILIFLPVVVLMLFSFSSKPPTNLGVVDGKLAPCPNSPNCVSTQGSQPSQHMEPIRYTDLDAARSDLLQVLGEFPSLQIVEQSDHYIWATDTSRIFRFVDDVEFYFDEETHLLHFRSASRVGRSDLGVNRQRMTRIQERFQQLQK